MKLAEENFVQTNSISDYNLLLIKMEAIYSAFWATWFWYLGRFVWSDVIFLFFFVLFLVWHRKIWELSKHPYVLYSLIKFKPDWSFNVRA